MSLRAGEFTVQLRDKVGICRGLTLLQLLAEGGSEVKVNVVCLVGKTNLMRINALIRELCLPPACPPAFYFQLSINK